MAGKDRRCLVCGAEMTMNPRVTKARWAKQRFCSPGCAGKATNKDKIRTNEEMKAFLISRSTPTQSGCLEYQMGLDASGYAWLTWGGKRWRGNRLSYHLWKGPIPQGGHIMHLCDNRKCINHNHLVLGDNAANVADRDLKNRQARGEGSGRAKLTELQVVAIRASNDSISALARQYGVGETALRKAKLGETWKHLSQVQA